MTNINTTKIWRLVAFHTAPEIAAQAKIPLRTAYRVKAMQKARMDTLEALALWAKSKR